MIKSNKMTRRRELTLGLGLFLLCWSPMHVSARPFDDVPFGDIWRTYQEKKTGIDNSYINILNAQRLARSETQNEDNIDNLQQKHQRQQQELVFLQQQQLATLKEQRHLHVLELLGAKKGEYKSIFNDNKFSLTVRHAPKAQKMMEDAIYFALGKIEDLPPPDTQDGETNDDDTEKTIIIGETEIKVKRSDLDSAKTYVQDDKYFTFLTAKCVIVGGLSLATVFWGVLTLPAMNVVVNEGDYAGDSTMATILIVLGILVLLYTIKAYCTGTWNPCKMQP